MGALCVNKRGINFCKTQPVRRLPSFGADLCARWLSGRPCGLGASGASRLPAKRTYVFTSKGLLCLSEFDLASSEPAAASHQRENQSMKAREKQTKYTDSV